MSYSDNASRKRSRLSIEVDSPLLRRLRLAASERNMTVRQYVLAAIEARLRQDGDALPSSSLTAKTDPVLAELWDNPQDGAYDRL